MNKKPNLSDYGLSTKDWDLFLESQTIRNEKDNFSLMGYIISSIIIGTILTLCSQFLAVLFATGFNLDNYNWQNFIEGPWQLIGLAVGFTLWGYIAYKIKIKSLDKKANSFLQTLSNKKLDMLEKYHKDLEKFKAIETAHENKKFALIQEFTNCNAEIEFVNNNGFFEYTTEELLYLIMDLHNNKYKKFPEELFDLYENTTLIKCIGTDSFIAKIEINEMQQYLANSKYESIIIYSLVDIDNHLVNNAPEIIIKNKFDIKSIYLHILEQDLKNLKKEMEEAQIEIPSIDEE